MEWNDIKPKLTKQEVSSAVRDELERLYASKISVEVIYQQTFEALADFLKEKRDDYHNPPRFYINAMEWLKDMTEIKRRALEESLDELMNREIH